MTKAQELLKYLSFQALAKPRTDKQQSYAYINTQNRFTNIERRHFVAITPVLLSLRDLKGDNILNAYVYLQNISFVGLLA
jgi:uncharacterized glyoxalase superfamily metalloenzyme YdcJ